MKDLASGSRSRAIVEAQGGRLELADRKGGGLLACATLPLAIIQN